MARNAINYTITDNNRDKGKTFVITEMSAARCEAWAMRAILALANSGADIPEGFERMGVAGIAQVGIRALSGLKMEVAKPLLDEMLTCVVFMPDNSRPSFTRPLMEEDVEEVTTLLNLRMEVWKLHTDFLKAVAPSMFNAAAAS